MYHQHWLFVLQPQKGKACQPCTMTDLQGLASNANVFKKAAFSQNSVYGCVCADIFTYLFICAGITSCGVDATTPELHLSPSGQRLGSPDYNLSVTVFLPSRTHLPCPLCWTLPCNALAQDTLIVLGRKITLCFSSLRRDWTAYSTAQQFLSLGKQNAIKISHYSSF